GALDGERVQARHIGRDVCAGREGLGHVRHGVPREVGLGNKVVRAVLAAKQHPWCRLSGHGGPPCRFVSCPSGRRRVASAVALACPAVFPFATYITVARSTSSSA